MAMKLSVLVEEYLIDCRVRQLSAKTIAGYRSFLNYFVNFLLENDCPDTLASFTLANGRKYSQSLVERAARRGTFVAAGQTRGVYSLVQSETPLKANTTFGYLRPIKTLSRWLAAEEQGYLASDVMKGLKLPRRPQGYEEPLTDAEMGKLVVGFNLRSPIQARDFAICMMYMGTGLRATELTNLEEDDVHIDEAYIRVKSGKGGKSRVVSLPPEVIASLFRYRQHFRPTTGAPHFFVTRDGRPMGYSAVYQVLRRAGRLSAIARVHPHLLRRTFGVAALTNGMDLFTLKETFGHSSIRTTEIYLKMSETRLKEQQRKTNPFAGVKLPKTVRKAKPNE
ncbi:MAG TPA: tyrosine-type recombinase/integrase [Thermomicrobiales bacterium]|jgi:integrase/recombinase XerD